MKPTTVAVFAACLVAGLTALGGVGGAARASVAPARFCELGEHYRSIPGRPNCRCPARSQIHVDQHNHTYWCLPIRNTGNQGQDGGQTQHQTGNKPKP